MLANATRPQTSVRRMAVAHTAARSRTTVDLNRVAAVTLTLYATSTDCTRPSIAD